MIMGEAGRGAYGLVKRVKEIHDDGSLGVSLQATCLGQNQPDRLGDFPYGFDFNLVATFDHEASHQISHPR